MSEHIRTTRPLRMSVIGAGRIVQRVHLPLLARMPDVQVVALYDTDHNRAEQLARSYNDLLVCRSLDELFGLNLDIALVACPNYLHATMSIAALDANLHVLCEKPIAITLQQVEAMLKAAERSGRELMIALPNRFRPDILAIRDIIEDDQLGAITAIRCGWLRRSGIPGLGTWFTDRTLSGGGALIDLGSHLIDLVFWLSGSRALLTANCITDHQFDTRGQAAWYKPLSPSAGVGCDVEVSASGWAAFSGPLDLFIEVSWASSVPYDQTYLTIRGERGVVRLDTLFGLSPAGTRPVQPLQFWQDGQAIDYPVPTSTDLLQPYHDLLRFFIESLRSGRTLRPTLGDNIATAQLIEAMYQAADQNSAHHQHILAEKLA